MTSPLIDPRGYSTVRTEGIEWIGTVEWLKDGDSPRKWDQVAGQGTVGATIKFNGDGLAEFSLLFVCWAQVHFDFFDARIRPLLRRPKEKEKPRALLIEHPELAKLEIGRCVVTNVVMLKQPEPGKWGYPVNFLQYRAAKPVQTLKASGDGPAGQDDPSKPPHPKAAIVAANRERNAELRNR